MRTNVLEVENLIRNYRKSVIKESEEDVKVLKGISFQVYPRIVHWYLLP